MRIRQSSSQCRTGSGLGYQRTSGSEKMLCPEGSHFRERESRDWAMGRAWVLTLYFEPSLSPLQRGTYLPQTYIIQEEMVVTEHVRDKESLGSFIYHLCNGKDTYRLRRRATRRRE